MMVAVSPSGPKSGKELAGAVMPVRIACPGMRHAGDDRQVIPQRFQRIKALTEREILSTEPCGNQDQS